MYNTLNELREKYSSCLIIIKRSEIARIYDEDSILIEYMTNIISKNNVIDLKYKYINEIIKILKSNKINYVILDKDNDYKKVNYYFSDVNKYDYYLIKCKKYNRYRRILIIFYNFIFGLPYNRYK